MYFFQPSENFRCRPARAVQRRKFPCTNAERYAPVGADDPVRPAECTREHGHTDAKWDAPKPPLGDQGEVARSAGRDEKVYVFPHLRGRALCKLATF